MNGSAAVLEKDLGVMEGHSLDMGQYHAVKKTNGKLAWIKKCITCMTWSIQLLSLLLVRHHVASTILRKYMDLLGEFPGKGNEDEQKKKTIPTGNI